MNSCGKTGGELPEVTSDDDDCYVSEAESLQLFLKNKGYKDDKEFQEWVKGPNPFDPETLRRFTGSLVERKKVKFHAKAKKG